jgi:hypothetical protein
MSYTRVSSITKFSSAGTNPGSSSLTSVPDGADLLFAIGCRNDGVTTGETVTSVSSSPSYTWTLVDATNGKSLRNADDTNGREGVYFWRARTTASGTVTVTPTLTNASANRGSMALVEMTSMASSSVVDKTAKATVLNAAANMTVGPTSTLAQATQTCIAAIWGRWWYALNGGYSAGTAPSGWTLAAGDLDNSYFPFQIVYKEVSATTAQSAAWDVPNLQGDGGSALLATFKKSVGALRTRVKFKNESGIDGVSGLTVRLWDGNSDSNNSTTYASITAESSGDVAYTPAPAGTTAGDTLSVAVTKAGSPNYASEFGVNGEATVENTP